MRFAGLWGTAVLVLWSFSGCDDSKIEVYRAEKEQGLETSQTPATAGENRGGVTWQAPVEWEEQPATGPRRGSFKIHGQDGAKADLSITAFPEDAGGLLANVNRWRGQIQLAPLSQSDLPLIVTSLSASEHSISFVNMVSEQALKDGNKSRILGGVLPLDDETWFFKLTGPDELVASETDRFKKFLETVKVQAAPMLAPSTGNSGSNTNAPLPAPLAATAPAIEYRAPPGWIAQPLAPMRIASFKIAGEGDSTADVSVVSLAGMAGGDLANVNRWRDQLKLPPVSEAGLTAISSHVQANGHDFLLTDLVSNEPVLPSKHKTRIVAAASRQGEQTWFVKMTGDDELVEAQKTHFLDFLRSLSIPSATRSDESSAR
jgi:hypothetical protein